MSQPFSHLPPDIAAALAKYEDDCNSGKIKFDKEGFAIKPDTTPDMEMKFFASKLPGMDINAGR